MNEQQAQKHIHQAVQDSLSWLDGLPSQENDILERVKKEDSPLITVYNAKNNAYSNPYASAPSQNRISRFRPILAFSAVIVLIAALWAIRGSVHTDTPIDRVTQPLSSQITPGTSGSAALPAAVTTPDSNDSQVAPLDRIDLYVEPDLLWNKETGILADGDKVVKEPGRLPFQNTTYRKMKDAGTKVDGELVYRSSEDAVLFRDKIRLGLAGDFSLDMPQKSFRIDAADGSFDFPLFDDRAAAAYPSILLRNSGNDSMWTRVQDGVQHRLIDRYTDTGLLTQAWRPVNVYLNDEYWGIYNMRETIDGHTICRHEQVPDDLADEVTILRGMGSSADQGSRTEFLLTRNKIKAGSPAENPEDLAFLEQEIDIDNFLDWFTVEMYFGNSDIGNAVVYKVPGGKWKCLIKDLDYALYNSKFDSVKSYLKEAGMGEQHIDNSIFLKILSVDKYRELFFTKLGNLFRTLTTENMWKELDVCIAWIEPSMKAHVERWAPYYDKNVIMEVPTDPEAAWEYWQKRVDRLRDVMYKRPSRLYEFIQSYFQMSNKEMDAYFPSDLPTIVDDLL